MKLTTAEAIAELQKVDTLDMPARLCEAHYMAIEALKERARWIPVISGELPEDMTYVLTTIQTNPKRVRVRSGNYYHGHFHNDNGDTWNATDPEVTAWMPLPKPYSEG